MSDPCTQEVNIVHIHQALDRMERTQERLVVALEKVAEQSARIDHLEEANEHRHDELDEVFSRLRDVELNQAAHGSNFRERVDSSLTSLELKMKRLNTILSVLSNKYVLTAICTLFATTVVGAVLDFLYHYESLKKILELLP